MEMQSREAMQYRFANCVLDTEGHSLTRDGESQPVEPQVFDMLCLLVARAGQLVSRDELVDEIWGGRIVSESAISARVAALRKVVGDDGKRQAIIKTVARRGLQFVAALDEPPDHAKAQSVPTELHVKYAQTQDGTLLAYSLVDDGDGVPAILIQHFPDHLEYSHKRYGDVDRFAAYGVGRKFLRFDYRGCGLSDWEVDDLSFETQTDDIIALADAAGFDRFVAIGTSSGGRHAIDLAARYPDRVAGVVSIAGYCDGRALRDQHNTGAEPILNLVKEGWDQRGRAFIFAYISLYLPECPHEWVHQVAAEFQASTNAENAAIVRDNGNNSTIRALLPKVQAPTLIVHSRDDAVHPLSEARKLTAGIKGAEMVVMDTANFLAMPDQPCFAREVQAVTDFLARLEE